MSLRGVKFQFRSGESVLCFEPDASKAKVLYDAKILDMSVTHDKFGKRRPAYLIHFLRWNSSWDRVVPESYLLKNSDENRALMRKLLLVSQKIKRNKTRMKKIDSVLKRHFQKLADPNRQVDVVESDADDASMNKEEDEASDSSSSSDASKSDAEMDEDDESDKADSDADDGGRSTDQETEEELNQPRDPIRLELPLALKKILQRDYHLVSVKNNLLKLPATVNVVSILEGYVKSCSTSIAAAVTEKPVRSTRSHDDNVMMAENNIQLCKEVADGLRIIFDFTLPLIVLYNCERDQYNSLLHCRLRQQQISSPTKLRFSQSTSPRVSTESQQVDIKVEDETEIVFKTDSAIKLPKSCSPRQRRKTKVPDAIAASSSSVLGLDGGLKRLRRSSRDQLRYSDRDAHVTETTITSPARKSSFGSPSSSRASSPERAPLKLTIVDQKPPEPAGEVCNWKLIPDELYHQVPAPPSLIYGAHHLLRLFVRLPGVLDQMLIPKRKVVHLVRHLELFIQYLLEHRDELFLESAYSSDVQ